MFLPDLTTAKALPICRGVPMDCKGSYGRLGLAGRWEIGGAGTRSLTMLARCLGMAEI